MYYTPDLAFIHHSNYCQMAEAASEVVLDLFKNHAPENTRLIDLGCGSGALARIVSDQGFHVMGIDYSEEMIKIAQEQAPKVKFYVGSFLDFDIPNCNAVTAIGEIFNYVFDKNNCFENLEIVFKRIHEALKPGGFLLFDSIESGVLGNSFSQQSIIEEQEWALFLDYSEETNHEKLERKIMIFRKDNETGFYRKSKETHFLHLYDRLKIKELLLAVGFSSVEISGQYGDFRLRDKNYVILARK